MSLLTSAFCYYNAKVFIEFFLFQIFKLTKWIFFVVTEFQLDVPNQFDPLDQGNPNLEDTSIEDADEDVDEDYESSGTGQSSGRHSKLDPPATLASPSHETSGNSTM